MAAVQSGFNSDLSVRGQSFHIQTEDWGPERGFLVSRVFCSGAVVRTVKTSYADALRSGPVVNDAEAVRQALRRQHNRVLDELMTGAAGSL
jgi:hypothetical protein